MDGQSHKSDSPPPAYEAALPECNTSPELPGNQSRSIPSIPRSEHFRNGASQSEIERMRRFLLHVLKLDYEIDLNAKLADGDWLYFTHLSQFIIKLGPAQLPETTNAEREVVDIVDAYFYTHVSSPALALGVPHAFVEAMVSNWTFSMNYTGRSHSMLLYYMKDGFKAFATRLFVDKEIMIPALVGPEDIELKRKLLEAVQKKINFWFSHFDSPDCFTVSDGYAKSEANLPNRLEIVRSLEPSFFRRSISEIIMALRIKAMKYLDGGRLISSSDRTRITPSRSEQTILLGRSIHSKRLAG